MTKKKKAARKWISAKAEISHCKKYRYSLSRFITTGKKTMVFVMLNPSTADAMKDDATIRRCVSFAKRESCDIVEVVNLYGYRATNPKKLWTVDDLHGPENTKFVATAVRGADIVVCAWGNNARMADVYDFLDRYEFKKLKCLGVTKTGMPKHPLYIKSDQELLNYDFDDAKAWNGVK